MNIDHVTVCGDDLERMCARFAAAGIATHYGGAHANSLTHMALAGFPDGSYIELIAPVAGAPVAQASGLMAAWMPLMLGNAGAGAWAIRVSGIHGKARELRERGIAVQGPDAGGRKRPDGIQLEWETALVGPEPAGSVLPFMIEDRTERSQRVQPTGNHSGIRGASKAVIGVQNLGAAEELFRRAYDWPQAQIQEDRRFGAQLAHFPTTPVILAAPAGPSSAIQQRLEQFGDGPLAFLFAVSDPNKIPAEHELSWFGERIRWLPEQIIGARLGLIVD